MELKPFKEEQICDACEALTVRPTYCEDLHGGAVATPHLHYECSTCGYTWVTETAHPIAR